MNHESINREISEELVNTTSQKKRGRPKKGSVAPEMNLFDDINTKKNISWSSHMEEHLLQLRLLTYKEGFINAKDKIALARTWNKILLDFNTKFLTGVSIEQLKNKFNALKSQYRSTSNSFIETGNNPLPKLPENWQTINQYFQGRDGLSGKSFGESESHTNMKAYNSAGESECEKESSKRSRSQSMGSNFQPPKIVEKVTLVNQ